MRRDADRLDALLSGLPPGPPAAFTDDVMRRVRAVPRTAPAPVPPYEPVMPWWTRALLQPATLGALVVAGLFAGWWSTLLRGATLLSSSLGEGLASGALDLPGWGSLLIVSMLGSLLLAYVAMRDARLPSRGRQPSR